MEALITFGPILLIVLVFWLLVLRPAKARQTQQAQLVAAVRPGSRIMTTAGLFGTVTDVTDDEIGLEIAPGVVVRYVKAAIARIVEDTDAEPALADEDVADVTDGEADAAGSAPSAQASDAEAGSPAAGDPRHA